MKVLWSVLLFAAVAVVAMASSPELAPPLDDDPLDTCSGCHRVDYTTAPRAAHHGGSLHGRESEQLAAPAVAACVADAAPR